MGGKEPSLGIIPIRDDSTCSWGCIDVDTYPLEHNKIVEKIRRLELPLIVCRSKSGGAHLFLFTEEPVTAEDLRNKLTQLAAVLGYGIVKYFLNKLKLTLIVETLVTFLIFLILAVIFQIAMLFWMMDLLLRCKNFMISMTNTKSKPKILIK
jgi:hypothetical protein